MIDDKDTPCFKVSKVIFTAIYPIFRVTIQLMLIVTIGYKVWLKDYTNMLTARNVSTVFAVVVD